jgi:hypothetical protein
VVHRQHGVVARALRGHEGSVGGQRAEQVQAFGAQRVEQRDDDVELLAAQVAAFAGVGVEAASASRVIAAGTALRGRCVVASATRSSGLASIITTSARARSAKNSVWPLNGMPASLIEAFCSGAVTTAA